MSTEESRVIYLEGPIAVGKSSVLQLLALEEGIVVLPEPIQEWKKPIEGSNLLQDIYEKQERNCRAP